MPTSEMQTLLHRMLPIVSVGSQMPRKPIRSGLMHHVVSLTLLTHSSGSYHLSGGDSVSARPRVHVPTASVSPPGCSKEPRIQCPKSNLLFRLVPDRHSQVGLSVHVKGIFSQ